MLWPLDLTWLRRRFLRILYAQSVEWRMSFFNTCSYYAPRQHLCGLVFKFALSLLLTTLLVSMCDLTIYLNLMWPMVLIMFLLFQLLCIPCVIWKAKNLEFFEDKNLNPKEVLFVVNSLFYEFMTSKPLPKPRVTSSPLLLGFPCLRDPCVSMLLKSTLMLNLTRAQEKGILVLCVEMQMGS